MKNRTVIGIICILLSVVTGFVLIPLLSRNAEKETEAIRIIKNVKAGSVITADCFETVKVPVSALPGGAVAKPEEAAGRFAACDLFAGDYVIPEKLTDATNATSFALLSLDDGELAVTVEITSFADGFSGQLRNGDIVQLFIYDRAAKTVFSPPELEYVSVITTVTGKGNSLDSAAETEDEDLPESLMLRVNRRQAALLFGYSNSSSVCCAFVCHADGKEAARYLREQSDYFTTLRADDDGSGTGNTVLASGEEKRGTSGESAIGAAHDIIFGVSGD